MDQTARSTALAISEPNRWPRTKKPTRRPAFLMNMSWSGRQDSNRPAVRTMRRGSDAAPAACDLTAQSTIQNKKSQPKGQLFDQNNWSGRQDSNRPAVRTIRRGSDAAPAACDLTAQSTIQNKKASQKASFSIKTIGRGDRIRTCDLYVPNVALYQTELHPDIAAGYSKDSPLCGQARSVDPSAPAGFGAYELWERPFAGPASR